MPTLKKKPMRTFLRDLLMTIAWLLAILVTTRLFASPATPSVTTLPPTPSPPYTPTPGSAAFPLRSGTARVFFRNHAANTGPLYCSSGQIFADGQANVAYSHTPPYPSVIFVGDGVNTDLSGQVTGVTVTLKSLLATNSG